MSSDAEGKGPFPSSCSCYSTLSDFSSLHIRARCAPRVCLASNFGTTLACLSLVSKDPPRDSGAGASSSAADKDKDKLPKRPRPTDDSGSEGEEVARPSKKRPGVGSTLQCSQFLAFASNHLSSAHAFNSYGFVPSIPATTDVLGRVGSGGR